MATIVNNPSNSDNSSGPITAIVVIIGIIVIGYLGYRYGLPVIRQMTSGGATLNVNVNQPKP
ncbi:MAG TPA: hypothetical protein VMR19_03705 [Candidatus Saccharimonadales bacterium]|jgi:hypothetical protein|nr:hypothetical protein [Candidatus Saccharimonadales bacterium]